MSRLVVGVIGHVDHGKTALVGALTGIATDRLAEEQARGISIALGFAHFDAAPGVTVDLIDMPGHERFVRTMIAGATGIDAVLLVVAANESVRPQTVEHVAIAGLIGVTRGVIAVAKADLVDGETARIVAAEAAELLAGAGIAASAPALVSARTGAGIAALREALAVLATTTPARAAEGQAFLPIDRAFAISGHGPVVTGTLRGGALVPGERIELLPAARAVRVRAVQVHGRPVARAEPGERVAVNLRGVEVSELARGMALAVPGSVIPSEWLTVALSTVADAPPLRNGAALHALFGTDEAAVRLRLLDRDVLGPAARALAQLRLDAPVWLPAGEAVILRRASPAQTVAGGRLLEPGLKRLRRGDAAILARPEALRTRTPAQIVAWEAAQVGAAGTTLERLAALTALAPARVAALLRSEAVIVTAKGLVIGAAAFEALVARIPAKLALHREGVSVERLLASLKGVGAAVLDEALTRLHGAGTVRRQGGLVASPRGDVERARAEAAAATMARLAERLRTSGLAPPTPAELLADPAAAQVIERLLRDGTIVRAVDRPKAKAMLFHRDAIAAARATLTPLLGAGLGPSEIGAALGITRKHLMPLLDHLDTIRFTRRLGDRRRLWGTGD